MTTPSSTEKQKSNLEIMQDLSNKVRVLESQVAIISSQRDAAMTKVSELAATTNVLLQDFESLRQAAESLKAEATATIAGLEKRLTETEQELSAAIATHRRELLMEPDAHPVVED